MHRNKIVALPQKTAMKAFDSARFELPLPAGHRFPMAKYRMLRERITSELAAISLLEAPAACDGELALVHTPKYIQTITTGENSDGVMRAIGFPWSLDMVERSRRSVGATVAAARLALSEGVSANLAGGTHHACADQGSGFCVFNDAAVAARLMQAEWGRCHHRASGLKVAIVDLDVHQGNGTAAVFARDHTVFTMSLHGAHNFPFAKAQSHLDVALPDRCEDGHYLHALDRALIELEQRFEPGLVIYLAGADPYVHDRLGRLALTKAGLLQRDRRVFDWCAQRRIPLVMTMAGGYGHKIEDTVDIQVQSFKTALEHWTHWQNPNLAQ
jgi:acetoin utilization deacetylase AcuC-like enzyme